MSGFDAEAFGQRIRDLRAKRRMSLEEVGVAAGFTKSHVWELETGRSRNPTVRCVWAMARALGTTPLHMLGLDPSADSLDPVAMEIACLVDRVLRDRNALKDAAKLAVETLAPLKDDDFVFNTVAQLNRALRRQAVAA